MLLVLKPETRNIPSFVGLNSSPYVVSSSPVNFRPDKASISFGNLTSVSLLVLLCTSLVLLSIELLVSVSSFVSEEVSDKDDIVMVEDVNEDKEKKMMSQTTTTATNG